MVKTSASTLTNNKAMLGETDLMKRTTITKVSNVMNVKGMDTSELNVPPFSRNKRKG
jgi:hypothetical protein